MTRSISGVTLCSATALMVFLGDSAGAQSAGVAAATPAPTQQAAGSSLEEVVVTAQKRSEKIQDVPIAVDAVTGGNVETKRIASTEDLKYSVPALNWGIEAAFSAPFLRGIGTDVFVPNADTDVATYIDGVFIADDTSSITNLMYLDRIEVLEGPQGTLYGRNAVAGAINVVTLTPGPTWEADVKIGAGDYAEKEASGYVSGPLTDTLYGGLYAAYSIRDSYETHLIPQSLLEFNGLPAHENIADIRAKFVWNLDPLKITATFEHVETESADTNTFRNIYPNALGYLFGAPKIIQNYVDDDYFPGYNKIKTNLIAVREEANFDWGTILGITGFRNNDSRIASSIDGTDAPLVGQTADPQTGEQYSQELQVLSPADSTIKWIGGIYLFREDGIYVNDEVVCPLVCPYPYTNNVGDVLTQSAAVFGQATIPVITNLDLTLGGRYTYDYKDFFGETLDQRAAFGDIVAGTIFPRAHKGWEQFNPKVTLQYKIDDTLLYATYSTGFKSGVFNQAAPAGPGPVNPEKLTDYEVGTKSDFFDGKLRLNTAAYYYDFSNIQVQVNNGGTNTSGAEAILENAAKAEAYGLELSGEALVAKGLKLSGSLNWEHTDYTSFKGAVSYVPAPVGLTQIFVNATGKPLQRAPNFTATLGAQYTTDLPGDFTGSLNLDWYYNSGFDWEATGALKEPAYNTLNGSISVFSPDGLWTGSFWAKNITNQYYHEIALLTGFGILAGDAPPRMFGFTLERKFGWGGEEPAAYTPPPPPAPAPAPPPPKVEAQRSFQVFFDFDKSNITDAAERVIRSAADAVKAGNVVQITITGHTDTVGTATYNQGLSERRAAAVKTQLVTDGVSAGEITTVGVGKNGLLVPTADGVREPQNRRAEIVLQ